jgi:hypothetical protein
MSEYSLEFTECIKCGYDISIYPGETPLCEECGGSGVRKVET